MRFQFLFLTFTALACFAVNTPAQSGRTKPSPTPAPTPKRTISGPSVLTSPTPSPQKTKQTPSSTPAKKGDDEVIKVSSVLVPIPVSVTELDGRPVAALKIEDFELKINGKPAAIAEMSRSEVPVRLAMLFDNSASVRIARDFERVAAIRFFRRVIRPDRDMAALFTFADYTRLEQAMTRDVEALTRAISFIPEPQGATALLDGVIKAAAYLRPTNGRRVIVIVSDGDDTYSNLKTTLEDVVKVLQINDCQVYVVKTTDFENYKRTGVRGGNANTRVLAAEHRMNELAEQTGGSVFSPLDEDEMGAAFTQIAAELSQQYVLSYYPEEEEAAEAGELRSIVVGVKKKPRLTIRARKGYYVPKK